MAGSRSSNRQRRPKRLHPQVHTPRRDPHARSRPDVPRRRFQLSQGAPQALSPAAAAEVQHQERVPNLIRFLYPHQASVAKPAATPPGTQASVTATT